MPHQMPLPQGFLPTDWLSFIVDCGSILGFASTFFLAKAAVKVRNKYLRLTRLQRYLTLMSEHHVETRRLIGVYEYSRPDIVNELGSLSGDLKSLKNHLGDENKVVVDKLIVVVANSSNTLTQQTLIGISGSVGEVIAILSHLVEEVKTEKE